MSGFLCFFDGFLLRARPPLGETVGGRLGARLGLGRLMANGVFSLFATRGKGGGGVRDDLNDLLCREMDARKCREK